MRLDTIQALRGMAALLVALYHLVLQEQIGISLAGDIERAWFLDITRNGFAGVDLFFVISGFIMVYITDGRPRSRAMVADFIVARIGRIYPLWWFFMLILMLAVIMTTGHWVPGDFGVAASDETAFVIRSFFLLPQSEFPYLIVGWTLIHEMYFYVIFTILLLAPRTWLVPLLLVWSAMVGIGNAFIPLQPTASSFLALAVHPMTLEFIAGALVGFAFMRGIRGAGWICLGLGSIWFTASLFILMHDVESVQLNYERLLAYGLPACLMMYGLVSLESTRNLTVPQWLIRLGDASYALYLCHIIVFLILRRGFEVTVTTLETWGWPDWLITPIKLGAPGPLDNLVFLSVGLAAAIIASWLAHRYVERPMLTWVSAQRRSVRSKFKTND